LPGTATNHLFTARAGIGQSTAGIWAPVAGGPLPGVPDQVLHAKRRLAVITSDVSKPIARSTFVSRVGTTAFPGRPPGIRKTGRAPSGKLPLLLGRQTFANRSRVSCRLFPRNSR